MRVGVPIYVYIELYTRPCMHISVYCVIGVILNINSGAFFNSHLSFYFYFFKNSIRTSLLLSKRRIA